ncbi:hypothetical protein SO694_00004522 [Aureococcus anophagefferens]|uniref:ATP-dependent DNA helicase n=1 Tax=Aureococcus anophagefferens TaxID=44056 RepID=A0ABR1G970_AURAN
MSLCSLSRVAQPSRRAMSTLGRFSRSLRVATCNLKIRDSLDETVARASIALAKAAGAGADVLALPECALPGYDAELIQAATPAALRSAERSIRDACRAHGIGAVYGCVEIKSSTRLQCRLLHAVRHANSAVGARETETGRHQRQRPAPGKPVVIDLADSDDDEKPAKARRVAEVIDLESDDEAPPAPAARRGQRQRQRPRRARPVPPLKGVKPEKRPVKPEAVKPEKKRPADDDGDVPLFSLKKKVSARPKKALLSEAGSSDDDGEAAAAAAAAGRLRGLARGAREVRRARARRGPAARLRRPSSATARTLRHGSGGNGKSHVTRTILDFFGEHYGDMYGQRVAVCAPTGIAATHVNGTTIHSAATGIGVPKCNEDFRRMHQGFRKELWTKLVEVLVIDEISMLSGEWFDNLDRTLRELARWYGRWRLPKMGPRARRGDPALRGIQVVVVGDFFQLPPIPATIHAETYQRLDAGLFHAQHSKAWFNADMVYVHLRTCHRVGAHEQKFVDVLNRLRAGARARDADARSTPSPCGAGPPDDVDPTEIWPTNAKVNAVNKAGLEKLPAPLRRFEFQTWVRPFRNIPPYITEDEIRHALETCDFIKYNKLIEPMVDLKPGCRVLLLKNIDTRANALAKKEQPLVNGTTGPRVLRWATAAEAETALAAREQALEDKLEAAKEQRERKGKRSYETSPAPSSTRSSRSSEPLRVGREEVVLPALFDEELVGQGVAYVMQMPLKLGYAVTIHKSQGMSLDHATISTSGCFAEGQAYVALSLVTGAKALALARPLKGVDVKTPKLSKTFYDLCDALAKEAEDLGGADALGMGPVALRGVLEGMPPGKAGRCYKRQQLGHWASDCPN